MEKLRVDHKNYEIVKILKSENKIYYYTLDNSNDNEVVIFQEDEDNISRVEDRDYPKLMNMFALK